MKIRLLNILLILITSQYLLGQQQEKIYYNSDWKVCQKSEADYYRLITFDADGKPKGVVRDYYITGELQWEGSFSYVDKYDNTKDISEGLCTWYYKNGRKARQSTLVHDIENGKTTYWYESGVIQREIEYKMGILHGIWADYYENGKLYRLFDFKDGDLSDVFFIECDEFGGCQKIFFEGFTTSDNKNEWPIVNTTTHETKIIPKSGLLIKSKTGQGYRESIRIPLDLEKDFSIETTIEFKRGETNNGHGLIWGFKDWDNYYYFEISANGYYRVGARSEGINIEFAKWTTSRSIYQNYNENRIKILRLNDRIIYSINGTVVHSDDFYAFRGNQVGFYVSSGKKEILFKNLIVKQDVDLASAISSSQAQTSDWMGNGTGFFIDKGGYIATNYHVVNNAKAIEVEFIRNGVKQVFSAEVVQSDVQNDLSIIKINSPDFKPFTGLPYNFKPEISDVGTNVFALGYPMALSLMGTEIKFTDGKISSKTGMQGDITTYQISVPIQPGNSGGPLFDYNGNLIGITSSGVNRELDITENVNYAIKSSYLKNLVDVLDYKLILPNDKTISSKTLTDKIKILSDYVVLIKVR